jgi:hypothetical protein
MKRRFCLFAIFVLCSALPTLSSAQSASAPASGALPSNDFIVVAAKVHAQRHAKNFTEPIVECTRSPSCKALVDAAGDVAGVDISLVTSAVARFASHEQGDMTFFSLTLPSGYEYCHSQMHAEGVNPPAQKRSPFLQAFAEDDGLKVQTWTPQNGLGGAGTSISASFAIIGVRADKAALYRQNGQCKTPDPKHMIVNCRGNSPVREHPDQTACIDSKD